MRRGVGRPKEKRRRTKVVHFRVYPEEYIELVRIAKRASTQPSKVVRNAVSAIIRTGRPITGRRRNPQEFEAMVRAVRNNPPLMKTKDGELELRW